MGLDWVKKIYLEPDSGREITKNLSTSMVRRIKKKTRRRRLRVSVSPREKTLVSYVARKRKGIKKQKWFQ